MPRRRPAQNSSETPFKAAFCLLVSPPTVKLRWRRGTEMGYLALARGLGKEQDHKKTKTKLDPAAKGMEGLLARARGQEILVCVVFVVVRRRRSESQKEKNSNSKKEH